MINGIGSDSVGTLTSSAGAKRSTDTRDQFMRLLIAELSNQDPMAPMDNTAFLQQMVALEQVNSSAALSDSLKGFQGFLQLAAAGGMIGMAAKALDADGNPVEGLIEKILIEKGNVKVKIGSQVLPFDRLTEVAAPF